MLFCKTSVIIPYSKHTLNKRCNIGNLPHIHNTHNTHKHTHEYTKRVHTHARMYMCTHTHIYNITHATKCITKITKSTKTKSAKTKTKSDYFN